MHVSHLAISQPSPIVAIIYGMVNITLLHSITSHPPGQNQKYHPGCVLYMYVHSVHMPGTMIMMMKKKGGWGQPEGDRTNKVSCCLAICMVTPMAEGTFR